MSAPRPDLLRCALAVLLAAAGASAPALAGDAPAVPEPAWETGGFSTPESVVFDRARGRYYVSNMATRGEGAVPGDGFISLLDAQGRMLERE